MTPETVHAISAVCALIERIGTWPIGTILLVVLIGPWVFALITSRAEERRVNEIKQMYENNVKLVDSFEKLAASLYETVMLNTAKWSEAIDKINTNQFCPRNRTDKQRMEDIRG
jgi:hypothetical protein